jgi:hypothetical protein
MPGLSIVDADNGAQMTRSQGSKPKFEHAHFKGWRHNAIKKCA